MPADADAVKAELARLGACPLCVLRFHGTRCASERDAYVAAAASTSRDDAPCPCCLGVLQLSLDVSSSRARSGEGACTSGDGGGDGDDAAAASGGSGKPKQTHVERVDVSSVMQYVDGMRAGGGLSAERVQTVLRFVRACSKTTNARTGPTISSATTSKRVT